MRVVRKALSVIVIVALQIVVMAAPGLEPDADAQISCTAASEAQLATCITAYNTATLATTIRLTSDIVLTVDLPVINNTAALPPQLLIDGQGRVLDGDEQAQDVLEQDAGNTVISKITLARGTSSGAQNNGGFMTIVNSTLTGNVINGVYADSLGVTTIRNSTIVGNGDGLYVGFGHGATVLSSTFVNNDVGLDLDGDVTVGGSLISGNTTADCTSGGGTVDDLGNNMSSDIGCPFVVIGLQPTHSATLADNGCTAPCTQTIALFGDSPAVDGDATCAGGLTDQRGETRTAALCDVGAFEAGDCSSTTATVANEAEFNFAIECYNGTSAPTSILMANDIVLMNSLSAIENNSWPPQLTIDGQGHILDGGGSALDLLTQTDGNSLITNMTMTQSASTAVQHDGGTLEITNSTMVASGDNAVFANSSIETVVRNSTIVGNIRGVVASASGSALVQSSTIVGNQFGYQSDGTVRSEGSLIAAQTTVDCGVTTFIDEGGNVYGDSSCTGTPTPDLLPHLGMLDDNGCATPCTQTVALLAGSSAIDADPDCAAGPFDQRGEARSVGKCDAGAFEVGDLDFDNDGQVGPLGNGPDCNDTDATIFTGATEIVGDGIDQDCDGSDSPLPSSAVCNGLAVTIDLNLGASGLGTAGNDVIFGTPGDDVINGLGGDDTICGEGGDDNISGDAGVDFIYGGEGDDILSGGDGNDRIRGQQGIDNISGGLGNDFLYGGIEGDTISGGDGRDTIGGFGGADMIDGGDGNDTIFGGFGADTILGSGGNDKILGLVGNDTIQGGAGDDTLNGDNGQDTISGGTGNDNIKGGNSLDTLFGEAGDDVVAGGKSDDTLSGGTGNDTCTGNTGTDTADSTCETVFGVP